MALHQNLLDASLPDDASERYSSVRQRYKSEIATTKYSSQYDLCKEAEYFRSKSLAEHPSEAAGRLRPHRRIRRLLGIGDGLVSVSIFVQGRNLATAIWYSDLRDDPWAAASSLPRASLHHRTGHETILILPSQSFPDNS